MTAMCVVVIHVSVISVLFVKEWIERGNNTGNG
jgi:hypothetical protein